MNNTLNVAFIGNPNCGKTTLFNAYTGAKLKVANWPGVTVEKKEGTMNFHDESYKLVDLPGIYSLTSYTMEEKLSREYILSDDVDVIIDVVDASSLERNLYLTIQLIELHKPVVLALNMMDIVEERGMEIDLHRLPEMLGIPVVPVSARKRTGLEVLMHAVAHHKNTPAHGFEHHHAPGEHEHDHHSDCVMVYSDEIEEKIDIITDRLKKKYPNMTNYRWHSIKLLENDDDISEKYPIDVSDIQNSKYESEIINQRYDFISEIIDEVMVNKAKKSRLTDKADNILIHRIWGIPVFLLIMALVFFLTFTVGDWLKSYFEHWIEMFSAAVSSGLDFLSVSALAHSLIVDGIIAGVGSILTFLPNIFILFVALAFLEDSGYMSRVAYIMDGIMGKIGLSGRAFIPMLLGFGCSVPAVMASRALEDKHDKIKVILVTPFMSCSARLPIYVMLAQMFFGEFAMLAAYSMYVIGVFLAILLLFIFGRIGKNTEDNELLIELPEYKIPNARTVIIYVWEKVKDYLTKAGTTIFAASVILWFLMNFGKNGYTTEMSESFAAAIGHAFAPLLSPAGLGQWKTAVSLISGIAAKELVVSSTGVLYGIPNIAAAQGLMQLKDLLAASGFSAINAYSMMLFCLLYIPCAATIAVIKKETGSLRWTFTAILLQLGIAWTVSVLFYQIASLLKG